MIGRHLSRIKLWAKRSREGGIEKLPTRDHGGGSKRKMTGKSDDLRSPVDLAIESFTGV